jgi:membrane-associated phospholipid phosphatase
LGDGLFAIAVIVVLFFYRKARLAFKLLFSFIISGFLAQLLKILFQEARPMVFMKGASYPYFVEGITNTGLNSFPSGHTTTAFAMASTIAFNIPNKSVPYLLLLLAIGVGYSRVYLGQHFFIDILGGAILGWTCSLFTEYLFFAKVLPEKFYRN